MKKGCSGEMPGQPSCSAIRCLRLSVPNHKNAHGFNWISRWAKRLLKIDASLYLNTKNIALYFREL